MRDRNIIACKFRGNSGIPAALLRQAEVAGASSLCLCGSDPGSAKRGAGPWRVSRKTSWRPRARPGLIHAGSCVRSVCDSGGTRSFLRFRMGSKQRFRRSSGIPMT